MVQLKPIILCRVNNRKYDTNSYIVCFFIPWKDKAMDRHKELLNIECPICLTQKVITGKWKLVILFFLNRGVMRFNILQKSIPGVQRAYLTQQLRELEHDGLIHREVYKVVPPKVEYSLTEVGKAFCVVLNQISAWGKVYMKHIHSL